MSSLDNVRVRIAPSPTGPLHVGTARAALFNELFARQQDGKFIVRIEDTDRERSQPAFTTNILAGLKWLGLKWDEGPDIGGDRGPYRQSDRVDKHYTALRQLIDRGLAYREDGSPAIKFKVTSQQVTFTDLIRGKITINTDSWGGDFVIARSSRDPLYHLAVVVDDADMLITHVIRGEDHLSNTARHILLQRALEVPTPQYAHLPLLLDQQRRKLSKRAGGKESLLTYRDKGYLPTAMLNYLALLGWNPDTNQEIFSHQDLIANFQLDHVQKSGAIFSLEKLNSLNKTYLQKLSPAKLYHQAKPFLAKASIDTSHEAYWQKALLTEQTRVTTLAQLPDALDFYRPHWQAQYDVRALIWQQSNYSTTLDLLAALRVKLEAIPAEQYQAATLTKILLDWIDTEKLGRGDTLWPLRYALTGKDKSPSPFEVAAVLGQSETLRRIDQAITRLTSKK